MNAAGWRGSAHPRWLLAAPWLISLSAHALLFGMSAGLPALGRQPLAPAAALTVLALPGDHAAAVTAPAATSTDRRAVLLRRAGVPVTGRSASGRSTSPRPESAMPARSAEASLDDAADAPLAPAQGALAGPELLAGAAGGAWTATAVATAVAASASPPVAEAATLAKPIGPRTQAGTDALVPAGLLAGTPPRYPEAARRAGIEGVAELRVQVDVEGKAGQLRLLSSSGSADLDAAALAGVAQWRFRPARRGVVAVAVWLDIPVRFALTADDHAAR